MRGPGDVCDDGGRVGQRDGGVLGPQPGACGFRHDPENPLESLAEYCLTVYTNRNLPMRVDMLENYVNEYEADGLLINSIKSCNSFSAGQLLIMREVEKRTGKPAAFIETDLVDPRYFSAANIKNRLESYFQMIEQKRAGLRGAA